MSIESVVDTGYAGAVDARLNSCDAYIEYQSREARRALPFLARFFDAQNARVLEVGAGHGGKGITYARAGMRVTSLDPDVTALQMGAHAARQQAAELNSLDSVAGDGTRLPFRAESFDAVLLDSVIEHADDPFTLLQECHRVLKCGGIVFVVFPPFYGPLSGHIDDFTMIPWYHLLPRETIKRKLLAIDHPIGILTPRDAYAVYTSLNRLSIFEFRRTARNAGFSFVYWRVRPFLTHPGTRLAVGVLAALRHPPRLRNLRAVIARACREFTFGVFLVFLLTSALTPLVFFPFAQEIAAGGVKAVLRKS